MKIVCCLLYVLMALFAQSVNAESWVDVGEGWYADRTSAKRKGELATIYIRNISSMDYINEMTIDCKSGIATKSGWSKPLSTKDRPILLKIQELACRRSWELWK
jgi:hypothetical protein